MKEIKEVITKAKPGSKIVAIYPDGESLTTKIYEVISWRVEVWENTSDTHMQPYSAIEHPTVDIGELEDDTIWGHLKADGTVGLGIGGVHGMVFDSADVFLSYFLAKRDARIEQGARA